MKQQDLVSMTVTKDLQATLLSLITQMRQALPGLLSLTGDQRRSLQLMGPASENYGRLGLVTGKQNLDLLPRGLDMDAALAKLAAIRDLGVRLAIDDFGTGYSSLSQLKRLPIDVLKIDRSFIKGIPRVKEDVAITEAILALGSTLGVRIVAEGVETAEQQAFLSLSQCHEMQGFYFSQPVPAADVARLLRANSRPAHLSSLIASVAKEARTLH